MLGPVAGVRDPQLFADDLVANGDAVRVGEWLVAPAELESPTLVTPERAASITPQVAETIRSSGVIAMRAEEAPHQSRISLIAFQSRYSGWPRCMLIR